jgi:hypothetical protein
MKKIAFILATGLAVTGAFGASVASDNSSNYGGTWTDRSNGGFGFGAWTINDGDGGHYIGSTGLGANTFGLFNTFTSTTTDAIRPFTGVLGAGDTFYSFSLTGSPGGINFNPSNGGISGIDNVRFFNFNQGPGANFGFDNLSIVPEPSNLALLAGPALLGGWVFVRRRRTT